MSPKSPARFLLKYVSANPYLFKSLCVCVCTRIYICGGGGQDIFNSQKLINRGKGKRRIRKVGGGGGKSPQKSESGT